MGHCGKCGQYLEPTKAVYRREIYTDSTMSSYSGRRFSTGSGSSTHFSVRNLCYECANQIDKDRKDRKIVNYITFGTIFAGIILAFFYYNPNSSLNQYFYKDKNVEYTNSQSINNEEVNENNNFNSNSSNIKLEPEFINKDFIVTQNNLYFYRNPDLSTRRKSYVINGDIVTSIKQVDNFMYVVYTNSKNITTKG